MRTEIGQQGLRSDLSRSKVSALIDQHSVLILVLCAVLFALCPSAAAQQPAKIPRIGYISGTGTPTDPGPYVEAFRQGLRELGYVEGKNFAIEYRGARGNLDAVPGLVKELVQLKVDV